jgi:hypothetical protein
MVRTVSVKAVCTELALKVGCAHLKRRLRVLLKVLRGQHF